MEILYNIERDGSSHFLAYMSTEDYNKINLPNEIKDNIVSFGLSIDSKKLKELSFNDTNLEPKIITDLFCCSLKNVYEKYWNFKYGVPIFKFKGKTGKFEQALKDNALVLFFCNKSTTIANIVHKYLQSITNVPNIYFLAEQDDIYFKYTSLEHNNIRAWLQTKGINFKYEDKKLSPIEQRLQQWYPDKEFRNKLLQLTKQTIDKFVLTKKIKIYIPEFLVVPVYHARRHYKAYNLIQEIYHPYMIMTLPVLTDNGNIYTALFPIIDPINVRNYNRK